jgi:DNA-binding transcriptional MerR regulator
VRQAEAAKADRHHEKSPAAFRTTGEAAKELDVPAYVLRFWEAKFPQVRPLKRGGGRRYYRPEDIDLLRRIRQCLYQEGYTIRGVQKLLGGRAPRASVSAPDPPALPVDDRAIPAAGSEPSREALRAALVEVRGELLRIRALLDELAPR